MKGKFVAGLIAIFLCIPLGIVWHELVGHGLGGVLLGGRIRRVDILWLELWPRVSLHGWAGYLAQCHVDGIRTHRGENLMQMCGALSTFAAAAFALLLLRVRRWGPATTACLQVIGLWWIDLLVGAFPAWAMRRSALWGGKVAEPYQAALALGLPGRVFQGLVIVASLILAWKWLWSLGAPRNKHPRFMFAPPRSRQ